MASSVRYALLLLAEGSTALPVHHEITAEPCMTKLGTTLLSATDIIFSPPHFHLFLLQPYACVLYMLVLLTLLGLKLNPLPALSL